MHLHQALVRDRDEACSEDAEVFATSVNMIIAEHKLFEGWVDV